MITHPSYCMILIGYNEIGHSEPSYPKQYAHSLAKLRSSRPLPDPRQHEQYRKLEEEIQMALGQEMYRDRLKNGP